MTIVLIDFAFAGEMTIMLIDIAFAQEMTMMLIDIAFVQRMTMMLIDIVCGFCGESRCVDIAFAYIGYACKPVLVI